MPQIKEKSGLVTQITTLTTDPGRSAEVLALMQDRAAFMTTQPGFVSVSLHRSNDGRHIVNYVQWESAESLAAAHHAPEFRAKWPRMSELTGEAEPALYDVVHVYER
jgi:heme-degrading monooxygenase HmoA